MQDYYRKLNNSQLNRLSEILGNMGILFFASVTLPVLLGDKNPNPLLIIIGIFLTLASWFVSMLLIRGVKKK